MTPNTTPSEVDIKIGNRLQRIARLLEKELAKTGAKVPEDIQFSLIIWNNAGRMQYVSNGSRDSVKTAMTELVAKWDRDGPEGDLGRPVRPLGGMSKINRE